jgi:hypothetical protein
MSHDLPPIQFDKPGHYVEQLLQATPDVMPHAIQLFADPGDPLPAKYRPISTFFARRAALVYADPVEVESGDAITYRGIQFAYTLLERTRHSYDIGFATAPIASHMPVAERQDDILFFSGDMRQTSETIAAFIEEAQPIVDPLGEQPALAQYGMCMAFTMANNYEIRKLQVRYGRVAWLAAERAVRTAFAQHSVDSREKVAAFRQLLRQIDSDGGQESLT